MHLCGFQHHDHMFSFMVTDFGGFFSIAGLNVSRLGHAHSNTQKNDFKVGIIAFALQTERAESRLR